MVLMDAKYGDVIGETGDGTCWIDKDNPYFQLPFFIPLVFYFCFAIAATIYASVRMKQTSSITQPNNKATRGLMIRMITFVAIFIACWTGAILHRLLILMKGDTHSDESVDALRYWDIIGTAGQGFANACVWLTSPAIFKGFKEQVLKKILALFCCCNPQSTSLFDMLESGEDEEQTQDIQKLDILLRKNIIRAILLGIRKSVQSAQAGEDFEHDIYDEEDGVALRSGSQKSIKDMKRMSTSEVQYDNIFESTSSEPAEHGAFLKKQEMNFSENDWVFTDYSPQLFSELRNLKGFSRNTYLYCMHPDKFLKSLDNQKFSEGKSGSFFCFSPDKSFILKTIPESEAILLKKILPSYYMYLSTNPHSYLIRIYGLHSLKLQNDVEIFVVVMGNVFNTPVKIHERYDLKGSWVNRSTRKHAANPTGLLGKDMDLKRKLNIPESRRREIIAQVEADARFLQEQGIMDYSLLLGFHFKNQPVVETPTPSVSRSTSRESTALPVSPLTTPGSTPGATPLSQSLDNNNNSGTASNRSSMVLTDVEADLALLRTEGIESADGEELYYLGIIDILQKYNCNKKMERCLKITCMRADKNGLSVQPDDVYCDRFVNKVERLVYRMDT
eukprot:CAMPEP_0168562144 /NCGR_PEP_ID=MMETSP0413-20121227/11967_1 /TAXON_ID=136452 /ORGANISM="Filamoeba nolandi, Strain NC-AS-23-1" /LENGTH=615 /DNA_ID=CAMNT_0008593553 /DNA_START=407 /DNA_END=2254 /DNA_ORIENTATION=-